MARMIGAWGGVALAVALLCPAMGQAAESKPAPAWALAMRGSPKYPADFQHFDYVRPDAPKGGMVVRGEPAPFDSLNPFILKGTPAGAVLSTIDSLMVQSKDEAQTVYGLIAQSITVPDDRSWAEFEINPKARFHDGSPITADDVVWTYNTLMTLGHPGFRLRFADVDKAESLDPRTVRFTFKPGDTRQLPLLVASLPVLSKAYYATHKFDETTLEPPLGNGAYKITKVDAGKSITLERVKDYWAQDLPVNRGVNNFDTIREDYGYRDLTVWLEAFKAGQFDIKTENVSKNWATAYDIPAVKSGQMIKEEIPNHSPQPMQALAFNLRRPLFQDRRVREALAYAFDFEWMNRTLFYNSYTRTRSYFPNSDMEAKGLPGPEEMKLLEPYRGQIPDEVFTKEYQPPKSDGSGNIRGNLAQAFKLLAAAGWTVKDNRLVDKDGKPFEFEILLAEASFERMVLPFAENLNKLGIRAKVRTIDQTQYQHRLENFDYDVTDKMYFETLSPGAEMRDYWGSRAADTVGSENLPGIKSAAIDGLIEKVINAPDQASLVTAAHALDRVLTWGFYLIPQWHRAPNHVVYWNMFGHPDRFPPYLTSTVDVAFEDWWFDPAKAATLTLHPRPAGP